MMEKRVCHRYDIRRMMRLGRKAPHTKRKVRSEWTVAWQHMASHDVAPEASKLTCQGHGHANPTVVTRSVHAA